MSVKLLSVAVKEVETVPSEVCVPLSVIDSVFVSIEMEGVSVIVSVAVREKVWVFEYVRD